jgi:hypothetical protein
MTAIRVKLAGQRKRKYLIFGAPRAAATDYPTPGLSTSNHMEAVSDFAAEEVPLQLEIEVETPI